MAENPCQFSENFDHNNHIGGPDGHALPLPSMYRRTRNPKNQQKMAQFALILAILEQRHHCASGGSALNY
jgi:hypothetical protein